MINSIIVDDEPRNVSVLQKLVELYCPGITVVGEASGITEAVDIIRRLNPQLVFLDIEMPRGNAFDLLDQLKPVNFEIIFVTAFDVYAIRAFTYSAIGYLLKPVDIDELQLTVKRVETRLRQQDINHRLENFMAVMEEKSRLSKIALPVNDGLEFYQIEDIVYCTAEGAYTQFGFVNGRHLLVTGTLKEFEKLLPPDKFCRVHYSHLINLDHVKRYYKGKGGYVEMNGNKTIDISVRKRDEFLGRLRSK